MLGRLQLERRVVDVEVTREAVAEMVEQGAGIGIGGPVSGGCCATVSTASSKPSPKGINLDEVRQRRWLRTEPGSLPKGLPRGGPPKMDWRSSPRSGGR